MCLLVVMARVVQAQPYDDHSRRYREILRPLHQHLSSETVSRFLPPLILSFSRRTVDPAVVGVALFRGTKVNRTKYAQQKVRIMYQ